MKTKVCTRCNKDKSRDEFGVNRRAKDGMMSRCKNCANAACIKYRSENLERRKAVQAKYNAANREKNRAYLVKYEAENPQKRKETKAKWMTSNKGVMNAHGAEYRAMKKNANPNWSDAGYIQDLYTNCREAEEIFSNIGISIKFHVDHIVPLQHELVCGLHVEGNLQILNARENHSKNNRFTPEAFV